MVTRSRIAGQDSAVVVGVAGAGAASGGSPSGGSPSEFQMYLLSLATRLSSLWQVKVTSRTAQLMDMIVAAF